MNERINIFFFFFDLFSLSCLYIDTTENVKHIKNNVVSSMNKHPYAKYALFLAGASLLGYTGYNHFYKEKYTKPTQSESYAKKERTNPSDSSSTTTTTVERK